MRAHVSRDRTAAPSVPSAPSAPSEPSAPSAPLRGLALCVALALLASSAVCARAQETLLPSTAWGFVPVISAWHFTTPIPQTSGAVQDVAQAAVPFRFRAAFGGGRWNFDISGAYAAGVIHTVGDKNAGAGSFSGGSQGSNSKSGGDDALLLAGPTDLKLRLSGPLAGDKLTMTAGLNLPTGITGLDAEQTGVLQAVGAPALAMPVGAFGTGAGGTLGLVSAIERGAWALAFGASVEQRTEYTPIAIALAGARSATSVTPGTAIHVSLGADRVVGADRLSLLLVADGFTRDKVSVGGDGAAGAQFDYTLGPQVTAFTRLDFSGERWREGATTVAVRYRSAFTDGVGTKVSGSNGTYLEGSIGGVRGGASGAGFVIGADGRWQSGLAFTDALVGAAATVGGVTLGFEVPSRGAMFRLAVRGQYGTFDTGTAHTTGMGATISLSWAARRAAQ